MADFSPTPGRWIRHWRRARGLTLAELAARVDCAPSLLSLVENGRREPRLSLLTALATALEVPIEELLRPEPPSDRDALELALARAQDREEYRACGLPMIRPGKAVPTEVIAALVGLHDQLAERSSVAPATPEEARRANAELRLAMRERDNYFGDIESIARGILDAIDHRQGPLGERQVHQIAEHAGFTLHSAADLPHSTRTVTDLRHGRIYLPASTHGGHDQRTLPLQALGHHVLGHETPRDYADFLRQRVSVNYFAAAILMDERQAARLLAEAKAGRYLAIEDLRDAFGVSYEMAAHRFTNLITRHCGIRVHFLKIHENGTIYKAYENNGVDFPADPLGAIEGQVVCREWASWRALADGLQPGLTHYQYTDTHQGTFWALSQTERTATGMFAVSIGTRFDDSKWFRGRETANRRRSTCPDPSCCRRAPADLQLRWGGQAWPSANVHAHLLSALPPGAFPGVSEVEVFSFLERHAPEAGIG